MSGRPLYFRFLTDLIGGTEVNGRTYEELLYSMYNRNFYTTIDMDDNRIADALEMRSEYELRFGNYVRGDVRFLEVIVALACRCEDSIMGDARFGNRIPTWFWGMIESMGQMDNDDEAFDDEFANFAMDTVLDRTYKRDGEGGLFWIRGCPQDLRNAEIWYQMCWWLDSKYSSDIENEEG